MSLLSIIIVLILVGVGLYVINSLIPMDATIKKVLNIVVIVVVCLWLVMSLFGGSGAVGGIHMPRLN